MVYSFAANDQNQAINVSKSSVYMSSKSKVSSDLRKEIFAQIDLHLQRYKLSSDLGNGLRFLLDATADLQFRINKTHSGTVATL